MTRILGVDPSLTGTGLAHLHTDDQLVIPTETITSKPTGASLEDRKHRILDVVETIVYKAYEHKTKLAIIEAPAFSRNNAGTWDRAGLWWLLVTRLTEGRTIQVATIPPTTRAKYATGRGNAGKDEVLLAVAKRYPHVDVTNNNEADSLVLAAIGARLVGHPIEDSLPKANLDALAKIAPLPRGWAA